MLKLVIGNFLLLPTKKIWTDMHFEIQITIIEKTVGLQPSQEPLWVKSKTSPLMCRAKRDGKKRHRPLQIGGWPQKK